MMLPLPFRKKKEKEPKKVYIPVDLVLNYASQGLAESEIISRLQSQGFAPEHIDRALRIALKERVTEMPQAPQPLAAEPLPPMGYQAPPPRVEPQFQRQVTQAEPIPRHPIPLGRPPERVISPRGPRQLTPEEARETTFTFEEKPGEVFTPPMEEITIEELIEGIVDERWKEFEERLIDFEKRDMQLQNQIEDIGKRIKEISEALELKEKGLASKLEEFGGSVENIEGRIGSIEKVFKDFLPELTQNIRSMSDLVDKIKEERK